MSQKLSTAFCREFLTVFLLSSVTVTPRHQQILIPAQQSTSDYNPGNRTRLLIFYLHSLVLPQLLQSRQMSPEQCFSEFIKGDEIYQQQQQKGSKYLKNTFAQKITKTTITLKIDTLKSSQGINKLWGFCVIPLPLTCKQKKIKG